MKKLLKKIRRRILQILHHSVPYNLSFRPTNHYSSSAEYLNSKDGGYYKVIYPSYLFELNMPTDLYEANLFEKPVKTMQLPDVVVGAVPNGRLYSDAYNTVAVITENNILLEDLSLELNSKERLRGHVNNVFNLKYFPQPTYYPGYLFTCLTGGGGIDNYFHWLFDVITRLHLLKESGLYEKIDWFLFPNYEFRYQKETLALLEIPESKIIKGNEIIHLRADFVVSSTSHRNARQMEAWECVFLRDTFLNKIPIGTTNDYRRIYITRNDSRSRNVLNEGELLDLLEPLGFQNVSLGGMSFAQQVQLFHGADIIVCPHGAGLANLVFCRIGTKVIEIFSEGWFGNFYHDLSSKVGLDYRYSLSTISKKPATPSQGKHQHFIVDIDHIRQLLQELSIQEKSYS
jgi:hypothetical protein